MRVKLIGLDTRQDKTCYLYGVTVDWSDTMFGPKEKKWIQVKVVRNGEYTVIENTSDDNNVTFDIIIHQSKVEEVLRYGTIDINSNNDDYGLNRIH